MNLELFKREIQTSVMRDRHRRSESENRFNSDVLQSVAKVEYRPYSRRSVDISYNWEKGQEYHQIQCSTGESMYKVSYQSITLIRLASIFESWSFSPTKR